MQNYCRKTGYLYFVDCVKTGCAGCYRIVENCGQMRICLCLTGCEWAEETVKVVLLWQGREQCSSQEIGEVSICGGTREYHLHIEELLEAGDVAGMAILGTHRKAGGLISGRSFYLEEWFSEENKAAEETEIDVENLFGDGAFLQEAMKMSARTPEELFESRPHIQLYLREIFEKCIRIDLADLEQLGYGHIINSFLCHGYHCYRHLLLAIKKDAIKNPAENTADRAASSTGNLYVLVPGVGNFREQKLADLYGFDGFISLCGHRRIGSFGYWSLRLPFLFEANAEGTEEVL